MLAYLDALIAALAARETTEIDRLLAHPLARILSPDALADATAERRAAATGLESGTPLRLLQLRYRTAQLLGDRLTAEAPDGTAAGRCRPPANQLSRSDRRVAERQMELPLSA